MSKDGLVPVKIEILLAIDKEIQPYLMRLESLISDHYRGACELTRSELLTIMEMKVSGEVLDVMLGDIVSEAEEYRLSEVLMSPDEITVMVTLSKMVGSSFKVRVSQRISMMSH